MNKQYIDKSALIAEIEKRSASLISLSESCPENTAGRAGFYAQAQTLEGIKNFLNTLEVKEVESNDACIKKAINFLNNKLDDVVAIRAYDTIIPHHVVKQELIGDFKKHMKGE